MLMVTFTDKTFLGTFLVFEIHQKISFLSKTWQAKLTGARFWLQRGVTYEWHGGDISRISSSSRIQPLMFHYVEVYSMHQYVMLCCHNVYWSIILGGRITSETHRSVYRYILQDMKDIKLLVLGLLGKSIILHVMVASKEGVFTKIVV